VGSTRTTRRPPLAGAIYRATACEAQPRASHSGIKPPSAHCIKRIAERTALVLVGLAVFAHAAAGGEFEDFLAHYGNVSTVAGTGLIDQGDVNGWLPSMEGALAVNAELSRPHMTMADLAGNLYIADKDAHAIRKVTPDGTIHTIAGTGVAGFNGDGLATAAQLGHPNGLYTQGDGTTYILDLDNARIRRLDTSGMLTTLFEDPEGIDVGRGLWVSPDESRVYYSSGTRVRTWTPGGGVTTYADGFAGLGNLDVDPQDGNLVVTDRVGSAVYRVFSSGAYELIAGNGTNSGGGDGQPALNTGLDEVRGIAFAPDSGYLLATHRGDQVWFVDTGGIIHLLVDGAGGIHAGDGLPLSFPGEKISEPRAVTFAPNGDLIITENDAGFVRYVPRLVPIPEPSTATLLLLGVVGYFALSTYIGRGSRRKRRQDGG